MRRLFAVLAVLALAACDSATGVDNPEITHYDLVSVGGLPLPALMWSSPVEGDVRAVSGTIEFRRHWIEPTETTAGRWVSWHEERIVARTTGGEAGLSAMGEYSRTGDRIDFTPFNTQRRVTGTISGDRLTYEYLGRSYVWQGRR